MSRKYILVSAVIICILFQSCSYPKKITSYMKKDKPNNHYYYDNMINSIKNDNKYKIYILETNYYKNITLGKSEISLFMDFIKCINNNNFIKKPSSLPDKPAYKMYIETDTSKYVINIYNEAFISICPWDGEYEIDYLNIQKIYKSYNLYELCTYLIPKED